MISKDNVIEAVLKKLDNLSINQYLDLRTYKRNRSVVIVKCQKDAFLIIEDGYEKNQFSHLSLQQVKKTLKTLLKKEFPRSNKIRIYLLEEFNYSKYQRIERKKI